LICSVIATLVVTDNTHLVASVTGFVMKFANAGQEQGSAVVFGFYSKEQQWKYKRKYSACVNKSRNTRV